MFLRISVVPPSIEFARARRKRYVHGSSTSAARGPRMSCASSVSPWLTSAHSHLPSEPSGPGSPDFIVDVSPRKASSRSTCASIATCASRDPIVRDRLAQLYIESEVLRLNAYRGLTAIMRNGVPGPEGSLGKWQWAEVNQALTELAMDLRGPRAVLYDDTWTFRFLRARANSIEGGTTEILKNIVAERVLGLPRMR